MHAPGPSDRDDEYSSPSDSTAAFIIGFFRGAPIQDNFRGTEVIGYCMNNPVLPALMKDFYSYCNSVFDDFNQIRPHESEPSAEKQNEVTLINASKCTFVSINGQ
jgi:hypothetical protein